MKLRFPLLVIVLVLCFSHTDGRHRQRGAKSLHRSKRTIGDIINWKLNLIQSILGGIGGIFGGGKSPKPSYGPPGRPQRPSYGARPQRPSYGKPRPSKPRPSYNRPNNPRPRPPSYNNPRPQRPGPGPVRPAGRPQFGPSNAIKMLPAPNLATSAPPSGGGGYQSASLGAPVLDSGLTSAQSGDSYGSPQASPVGPPQANTDDYGAPQASPVSITNDFAPQASAGGSTDDYGAPQAAPISSVASRPADSYSSPPSSLPTSSILQPQSQYGSGATNTFNSHSDPVIVDNSLPFAPSPPDTNDTPVLDSYSDLSSIAAAPQLKEASPDSYGAAQSPVLPPAAPLDSYVSDESPVLPPVPPVTATTARSFTVDDYYDDYDPSDIPADQANPEIPSYGISSTPDTLDTYGVASNSGIEDNFLDDYDPFDVPADQVGPIPSRYVGDALDVYGSAVAPVGTSAPVPDDVFTGDYTPSEETVIDLTEEDKLPVIDIDDSPRSEVVEEPGLLPPVEDEYDQAPDAPVTPTSSPVLFTYAPAEGSTVEDLVPQLNIVVQSPEEGGSLSDPLNVIPDEYEDYVDYEGASGNYVDDTDSEQEDPAEELEQYSPGLVTSGPTPAFEDLRGVEFSSAAPDLALSDPQPTTYRAPIDFDLGTTASSGIDVVDVVLLKENEEYDDSLSNGLDSLYPDEYEADDETDYKAGQETIPIVLEETEPAAEEEEALASYDPVVLLVGTPEKGDQSEDIPLFENNLEPRIQEKRKAKEGASKLKTLYNNWYGPRNDWSRKIAKVQGRIRFKKLHGDKNHS